MRKYCIILTIFLLAISAASQQTPQEEKTRDYYLKVSRS
jgi:hypothetical protein